MDIKLPADRNGKTTLFSRLNVEECMRRRAITLTAGSSIALAIRTFIKHKIDAALIVDDEDLPAGVVSRTEIMGAYYAALPVETPLGDIMASPVIQCSPGDTLESALTIMQQAVIHRIYVTDTSCRAVGSLSYPDIVGMLYKYCCYCEFGLRKKTAYAEDTKFRYTVKETMTAEITSATVDETIEQVIEKLSSFRLGALLITDTTGHPAGVISKADLALAYSRGIPADESASAIMNAPPQLCHQDESLEEAIRRMILKEISRLFIYGGSEQELIGVLSLSDAARIRSGSCHACSTTRIKVKE